MKKIKKICLVSSGQPFGNPRLVKEAVTFAKCGYDVTVLYTSLIPTHDVFDASLIKDYSEINWKNVVNHDLRFLSKFKYYRLRKKIWSLIYFFIGNLFDASIKSSVLYSQELTKAVGKVEADLYVGHNLGALAAVFFASKRFKAKVSFDFEDFHRGESISGDNQSRKVKQIEDKYVPLLDLATCASPLIEEEYRKLYPKLQLKTINNCFPLKYRSNVQNIKIPIKQLKIFWFSQYIGKDRGLEDIIRAIGLVNDKRINLTLLGNISQSLKSYFSKISNESKLSENQLIYLGPVPEKELVDIGQQYHIGLASEVLIQENRNYCLTNKVFIYLLSKNAILFSNTKAQSKFLSKYPGVGMIYNQGNIQEIAEKLIFYLNNPVELANHRKNSEQLGNSLNWENESIKLLHFYNLD